MCAASLTLRKDSPQADRQRGSSLPSRPTTSSLYVTRLRHALTDCGKVGNHGLYRYEVAYDIVTRFVPRWSGRYLASNVNITIDGVSRPFASRFRRFTTARGLRVFSLGVIFDFKLPAKGLAVQSPSAMVRESWFLDEMEKLEPVDVFVFVGHMPVYDPSWRAVLRAIRQYYSDTPMCVSSSVAVTDVEPSRLFFGGHAHVRDCSRPDSRSILMAAGRYMETVGWLSGSMLLLTLVDCRQAAVRCEHLGRSACLFAPLPRSGGPVIVAI